MTTSRCHVDTAPAWPLPHGGSLLLPAPGAMRLDDWAALLDAVTERLQWLSDGVGAALPAGTDVQRPLQECVEALRQLRLNLQAGRP